MLPTDHGGPVDNRTSASGGSLRVFAMPTSRLTRRAPRRIGAALAAIGALALVLMGCVGSPTPTQSPTPTEAVPIFASDEEALAAALKAYELYAAASQEITDDGGAEPERIDPFVTEAFAETLYEEFAVFRESGTRYEGTITSDRESLVEWDQTGDLATASMYLCRDVSGVRVFDVDGVDVTPANRDERVPTHLFLVSAFNNPTTLLVDGIEKWSGDDFC